MIRSLMLAIVLMAFTACTVVPFVDQEDIHNDGGSEGGSTGGEGGAR